MAKGLDPKPSDWDEPIFLFDGPAKLPVTRPRQMGIGRLMVWLIYFAILSLVIRQVYLYRDSFSEVILGVAIGLGLCYLGFWMAMKLLRFPFLGWSIFIIGFCVAFGSTNGGVALPLIPILIGAIIYLSLHRHGNNQDALLGIMALSAERGMPLAPGIFAFSGQTAGRFKFWAGSLAEYLRRGVPLADAVAALPRVVPRSAGLLIRMGTDSGNLAAGLCESVQARSIRLPAARAMGTQIAYLSWVGCTGVSIIGFLSYFIIPKFEAIFRDFGITLPEITIQTIRFSHLVVDFFWIPFLLVFGFGITFLVNLFQGGEVILPIFDRLLLGRRHTILILRSLVLFIEADRPISSALDSLAQWYPTFWVRRKLARASVRIQKGENWVEVLQSTGLFTQSDAGVLASAQRAGNLAWAIRELTLTSERRWQFRLQGFMQIAFIGSMLILGAVVFFMAVAYFSPLTTLIMRLS